MATRMISKVGIALEESGRVLVQGYAMSYGLGFSPRALLLLHEMIRDGVAEMDSRGQAQDPDRILEAQNNLAHFIKEAVADAQAARLPEVEEQNVLTVRASFCPVYPFS